MIALAFIGLSWSTGQAGTIWDGGGSDDFWTTGNNWNPAIGMFQFPPPNNGTADIVFPAVTGLVQTPIVDVSYSIRSMTFNSDGGNGRFVILGVEELTIGAGGITNNDADIQSVIGPVKLSADQTWNAAAGPLQMDAVNLNGFDLTLDGAHPVDLPSVMVGAGDLTVDSTYTSTVTMSGPASNTYAGSTIVFDGTLKLQKSGGATAVPGSLSIGGGATARLFGNEQISHAPGNFVNVYNFSVFDLNGYTETIAYLYVFDNGSVTTGTGMLKIGQYLQVGDYGTVVGNISLGDVAAIVSSGGELNAGSNIVIGDAASGTLDIYSGGHVSNVNGIIGNQAGSTGAVTVDDFGSTWNNNGILYVGFFGNGTLDILAGGDVTSTDGAIGYAGSSAGEVNVDGIGSTWLNNNDLYVGDGGTGTLDVTGGGAVTVDSNLYVGYPNLPSAGTLNVASGGAVTVAGNAAVNSLSMIDVSGGTFDANGSLTIDGGSLTADAGAVVEIGQGILQSGATVVVQNESELTESGSLSMESGAVMQVNSGAIYNTSFTQVGTTPGPAAELIVDGADTLVSTTSCCIDVGYGGAGVMTVTGGARVETPTGAFGSFGPGSVGTVTLDGTDANGIPSSWITVAMNMGLSATSEGTLNIRNGALFRATSNVDGLAVGTPGTASVFVEGTDGMTTPSLLDTELLKIGTGGYGNGTGEVTASAGGRIEAGNVLLAPTGGNATLTLTDAGTALEQSGSANITVGHATDGSATFSVRNNARVTTGTGPIDIYATGQINLESGAVFDANGPINLQGGAFNFLGGTLHVDAFNGNLVNEGGTLAPGHSVGTTAISGNYTQREDATLEIEIGDVFPGDWDVLTVEGNASLDGSIEVVLVDDFEPVLDNSFTVITTNVGNVGGQFNPQPFPIFNGLTFDVVYNAKSVVLTVIEAPLLPGDYNNDGRVDAGDYVRWRNHLGDADESAINNNGDGGDVSLDDYTWWKQHYGTPGTGGLAGMGAVLSVPEPRASLLAVAVLFCGVCLRRRLEWL